QEETQGHDTNDVKVTCRYMQTAPIDNIEKNRIVQHGAKVSRYNKCCFFNLVDLDRAYTNIKLQHSRCLQFLISKTRLFVSFINFSDRIQVRGGFGITATQLVALHKQRADRAANDTTCDQPPGSGSNRGRESACRTCLFKQWPESGCCTVPSRHGNRACGQA